MMNVNLEENGLFNYKKGKRTMKHLTKSLLILLTCGLILTSCEDDNDKKGAIVDEWDGQVLINSKTYREIKNASVMADVEETQSASAVAKSVGKDMFVSVLAAKNSGVASITAGLLYSSKELDDGAKAQGYESAVTKLKLVQSTIK